MANKKPRVFIGFYEIAGYNGSLKRGFDELGVDAHFYNLNDHLFSYNGAEVDNRFIRLIKLIDGKAAGCSTGSSALRPVWLLGYRICTALLGLWALPRYDTFIFSFGMSFLHYYDLPVLRFFNKQVIFVYLGSDSRPPYLNRKNYDNSLTLVIRQSQSMKRDIKMVERYADYIINHPPTGHFHERKFVQFMKIGIPTWFRGVEEHAASAADTGVIRILHAPSHEGKGTDRIRSAIASLEQKGYRIEYVEIINRPNAEVLLELRRCDFVVDELYSDTIMARFAAEAAFFSKPAIVGGYAEEYDFGTVTADEIPPVHRCLPEDIEAAIEKLICDVPYRLALGRSAKEFLDRQWSPRAVAARFLRLISNDVPADWLYDPRNIRYLHGWGLTDEQARTLVRRYIDAGGVSALQLDDKPRLAERFGDFSCGQGCT